MVQFLEGNLLDPLRLLHDIIRWRVPIGVLESIEACRQLYYIFFMLCQGLALSIVICSGTEEGFLAWYRLHQRYELLIRTRFAGLHPA